MLDFALGVLGSMLASAIIAIGVLVYKYIRRGKALQTVLNDRKNIARETWVLSQRIINSEDFDDDTKMLALSARNAARGAVTQLER